MLKRLFYCLFECQSKCNNSDCKEKQKSATIGPILNYAKEKPAMFLIWINIVLEDSRYITKFFHLV